MGSFTYLTNCTVLDREDVYGPHGLQAMGEKSRKITRRTFVRSVDRRSPLAFEETLGYALHPAHGLTMAADRHVTYHSGTFRGQFVSFVRHASIAHIFMCPLTRAVDARPEPEHQ